jgi:hypothetical protein
VPPLLELVDADAAIRKLEGVGAREVPLPQMAIAIAPPAAEPTRPIATVSQTGIGSGPGTASRARPPVMKPKNMTRMIEPSTRAEV